jgi:hypothetical protein
MSLLVYVSVTTWLITKIPEFELINRFKGRSVQVYCFLVHGRWRLNRRGGRVSEVLYYVLHKIRAIHALNGEYYGKKLCVYN